MKNQYYHNIQFTGVSSVKTTKAGTQGVILDLNGFYRMHQQQVRDWTMRGLEICTENKFQQVAIQPQPSGHRESRESIKEYSQVCFVDIDSKTTNVQGTILEGVTKQIIDNHAAIMQDSPFIFLQESISGGVHVIAYMHNKPTSEEDYKRQAATLTAYFCKRVQDVLHVDLTSVAGVVDTHNINPAQLLLVSPTQLFVNVDFCPVEMHEEDLEVQFPTLASKSSQKSSNVAREGRYTPIDINDMCRYAVYRKKKVKFRHLGDEERYKIATSLKTLVATRSITSDEARALYAGIMAQNNVVSESFAGMMRKFDEVCARQNIRPFIAFNLLQEVGVHLVEIR